MFFLQLGRGVLSADMLLHEKAVAAGTQQVSTKGPRGVEKDALWLKAAVQSQIYLGALNTLETSL